MKTKKPRGICKNCGKEFIKWQKNKMFCSEICSQKFFNRKYKLLHKKEEKEKEKVKGICKNCGKEYFKRQEKQFFCCSACSMVFHNKETVKKRKVERNLKLKTLKCPVCGKMFKQDVISQKFCKNYECIENRQRAYRQKHRSGYSKNLNEEIKYTYEIKKYDKGWVWIAKRNGKTLTSDFLDTKYECLRDLREAMN